MAEQNENERGRKIIPFYAVRLRDLTTAKARLEVICGFCGKKSELDVLELIWKQGPDADIRTMGKRLRCQKCGEKGNGYMSLKWCDH